MNRKILLVSDGLFHPPLQARRHLHSLFTEKSGCDVRRIRSLEKLPEGLDSFDSLVFYFHHKDIADEPLQMLNDYVSGGGGLLAVHSATASFKGKPAYAALVGGTFTGHGPVTGLRCRPVENSSVFSGLPDFTVRDELYLHRFEPDIQTHYTCVHEGEPVPVVWTREHGQGRVCVAVPGHTVSAMQSPVYRDVLLRGLEWVSGS